VELWKASACSINFIYGIFDEFLSSTGSKVREQFLWNVLIYQTTKLHASEYHAFNTGRCKNIKLLATHN